MSKRTICIIDHCGRKLSANARSPVCPRCRSGFYYWDHKTPKEREERDEHLQMLRDRFEYMREHVKSKKQARKRTQRSIPPAAARMAA